MDRVDVRRTMEAILGRAPVADFRLVGTASCVLRGIEVPASDVDVLFRERAAVDAWTDALSDGAEVNDAPAWLEAASQYFARLTVVGVTVELSTVEIEGDADTGECVGPGPWVHFDIVPCGEHRVPSVALELRLATEVARQRPDRWEPILAYLGAHPCDVALVERSLIANGIPQTEIARLVGSLAIR